MNKNDENWLIAYDGTVKHVCQNQKKKHKRKCATAPSDVKLIYDKNKNPVFLRCLCCDSKRKLNLFDQKLREKITKIYSI